MGCGSYWSLLGICAEVVFSNIFRNYLEKEVSEETTKYAK